MAAGVSSSERDAARVDGRVGRGALERKRRSPRARLRRGAVLSRVGALRASPRARARSTPRRRGARFLRVDAIETDGAASSPLRRGVRNGGDVFATRPPSSGAPPTRRREGVGDAGAARVGATFACAAATLWSGAGEGKGGRGVAAGPQRRRCVRVARTSRRCAAYVRGAWRERPKARARRNRGGSSDGEAHRSAARPTRARRSRSTRARATSGANRGLANTRRRCACCSARSRTRRYAASSGTRSVSTGGEEECAAETARRGHLEIGLVRL